VGHRPPQGRQAVGHVLRRVEAQEGQTVSRAALGDESRFELAMAAAGRERANRPRILVVLAVVALLIALLAAVLGLTARAKARTRLAATLGEQTRVDQMLKEWDDLKQQEQASAGPSGTGQHLGDLDSRMEDMARRAGIKDTPPHPRPNTPTTRAGVKVFEYAYTGIKDPSPKPLLEWCRLAAAEIPGLEVYSIDLKPDPNNWTMDVIFRRWERVQ
jgi:hypothetical protein